MSVKLKVLSYKNLPPKLPWMFTAVIWLLIDRLNASEMMWGVIYVLLALLWILAIIVKWFTEPIDIFKGDN